MTSYAHLFAFDQQQSRSAFVHSHLRSTSRIRQSSIRI